MTLNFDLAYNMRAMNHRPYGNILRYDVQKGVSKGE